MSVSREKRSNPPPDDLQAGAEDDEEYVDFEEDGADYYGGAPTEQLTRPLPAVESSGYAPPDDEEYGEEGDYQEAPPARSNLPMILASAAGLVVVLGLVLFLVLRGSGTTTGNTIAVGDVQVGGTTSVNGNEEIPRPGYMAPDFTLDGVNGGQVKLSSFRGQKPVWVNFWATWCEPCKVEMPEMEQLYPQYKDQVEFVGVDVAEAPDVVRGFLKQNPFSWTFALDANSKAFNSYYSTGIPTHAFIRRNGLVSSVTIGSLSKDMMVSELQKLLK